MTATSKPEGKLVLSVAVLTPLLVQVLSALANTWLALARTAGSHQATTHYKDPMQLFG
jgi:hypothetical protein